ncbi:MAG: 5-formaminoimidazole-4-carboxamide-1-(beta)-D-ribofuranosyl 5'-monophosphate synthetase [Cenarchaeum symbiont of Oopsacas minuta]|nr:5-formaminoimidazole-4-carboxamide-1-(beta)-D-ribofuranosyl 5'-monophosphate synthetase [Cenarchaeum symbiont of Oopsacas minuta]
MLTSVATLGSHCAMQVLKGAKDEGFKTVLICERKRESLYSRFSFIDKMILVDAFTEVADKKCQDELSDLDSILIPHGTLVSQLDSEKIEAMRTPIFGNKMMLRWESDRNLKEKIMRDANLKLPRTINSPSDIDTLVIVKRQGAAGGKGYFIASNKIEYERQRDLLVKNNVISKDEELYIQEYIPGVLAYLQFFYSPLDDQLEFFGADQRHESDIEGLGRIPANMQNDKVMSFNVIGNTPIVLRESLLEDAFNMGERFVKTSADSVKPGMNGPFCIEGTYDEDAKFTAFEFSARIVAGTNIYMDGSPYYGLLYGESISMGRRIAREIKRAKSDNRLDKITT